MCKYVYVLLFALIGVHVSAQEYVVIDTANIEVRKAENELFKTRAKLFRKELTSKYKGLLGVDIRNNFDEKAKELEKDILKGQFVFDKHFDDVLKEIIDELKAKNEQIPVDMKFYVSRDLDLNAASMGDKTFIVNMGLFYFLQNKGQIAAILSHEIAHLMLNHSIETISNNYQINKTDLSYTNMGKITETTYNMGNRAYNQYKKILYNKGRFSKNHEYKADSMAYCLLRNTKYSGAEVVTAMRLMEIYDTLTPIGLNDSVYKKVFNIPGQPFNEKWMLKEDFSKYDYSKYTDAYNVDSLSSHPQLEERIANLKRIFPELSENVVPADADSQLINLRYIVKMEQPASLMITEDYGQGIYFCLYRIQQNDHPEYYKKWLGSFFQKVYQARKEYRLNHFLDRLDPENQPLSYQQFLNFMWNLSMSEIKEIADYYNVD